MRSTLFLLIIPILAAQSPTPKEVVGKELPSVTGPQVRHYCDAPGYQDPALGSGNSVIQMRIRESARRSPTIPAKALPSGAIAVSDTVDSVAGWKAYRVEVPPGAKVHARVYGDHPAWFLVRTVNQMGNIEKGMLQNMIPTGNPEASYINPKKETSTIFFVVDTTQTDSESEPYKLTVDWPQAAK